MRRKLAALLLLAWALPALACNLPVAPTPDVRKSVLETLAALATIDPPPGERAPAQTVEPARPAETLQPAPQTPLPPAPPPPEQRSYQDGDTFHYITQPGDTAAALALRFGVPVEGLMGAQGSPNAMLPIGQELTIPNQLGPVSESSLLLPDSEVVYSPTSVSFAIEDFVRQAGGYLSAYSENVDGQTLTGAQVILRVAQDTSISPRLLLALLEYRSGWVFGSPAAGSNQRYPYGFFADQYSGLHREATLAARQLTIGYYGWRSGKVTELEYANHSRRRVNPLVNAGTAAVQYLFSKLYSPADWQSQLYDPGDFLTFYQQFFGDPWQRDAVLGPLLPDGLTQPALELPFPVGEVWTMTGGPHSAWGVGSAWGGLDFAPSSVEAGCGVSHYWTTAAAPGLVLRAGQGQVIIDLDGDGYEQTGWVLLYMHVAQQDRVAVGTRVDTDARIGHPSCEGGFSTGTHVHISRKYNGEWLSAGEPLPFVLSGWQAWPGERAYSGTLTKGDQVVTARPDGMRTSVLSR